MLSYWQTGKGEEDGDVNGQKLARWRRGPLYT